MKKRPDKLSVENKLMPLLPDWIKEKIIDVYPIDGYCNTCMGNALIYNYVIVLPVNDTQEITFSILNNTDMPEKFEKDIEVFIDVYKDILDFYEKYGKPLNIISLDTDDFGMYLPDDFYSNNLCNIDDESEETDIDEMAEEDLEDEFDSIKSFIENVISPRYTKMHLVEELVSDTGDLTAEERNDLNAYYKEHLSILNKCIDSLNAFIPTLKHEYFIYPVWDSIDIYMSERYWQREFCIKWKLNGNLDNLKRFDELRPLIDHIIEKIKYKSFAIGVKCYDECIMPCDPVNGI